MSGATRPLRKIVLATGDPRDLSEIEEESGMEIPSQSLGLREADSRYTISAVPRGESEHSDNTDPEIPLSW